jgi:hypothetical protein
MKSLLKGMLFLTLTCVASHLLAQAKVPSFNETDSLKNKLNSYLSNGKIDSLKSVLSGRGDGIKPIIQTPQQKVDHVNSEITNIQSRLTSNIDSLSSLPKPDKKLIGKLDSIRTSLDSLRYDLAVSIKGKTNDLTNIKALDEVNEEVNAIQGKISAVQDKVNEKLEALSSNGGNIGKLNIPSVNGSFSNPQVPQVTIDALPRLDQAGVAGLDDYDFSIPDVTNKVKLSDASLDINGQLAGKSDVLDGLKHKTGALSSISKDAGTYTQDAKEIANGNVANVEKLPADLERNVSGRTELNELKANQAELEAMKKKWNSDPEVAKEMLLRKAKEQTPNYFAGHEQELKTAMQQLTELKQKQKDAEGLVDLIKMRSRTTMKGRPLIERVLPGLGIQFQSKGNQWFDFNPYAGYRWTTRWTTGIGWNDRLSANFKKWETYKTERISGPRSYVEFKLKENFHLKAEAEFMKTTSMSSATGELDSHWIWSYFAGIKKSFTFSPEATGNVQVLYNLYDPFHTSPYASRVNIRMGFEFPLRKVRARNKHL